MVIDHSGRDPSVKCPPIVKFAPPIVTPIVKFLLWLKWGKIWEVVAYVRSKIRWTHEHRAFRAEVNKILWTIFFLSAYLVSLFLTCLCFGLIMHPKTAKSVGVPGTAKKPARKSNRQTRLQPQHRRILHLWTTIKLVDSRECTQSKSSRRNNSTSVTNPCAKQLKAFVPNTSTDSLRSLSCETKRTFDKPSLR